MLLEDWLDEEVDVVEVSSITSSKDGEVAAVWSFNFEWVATAASVLVLVILVGFETNEVHEVTMSTKDFSDELVILELNGFLALNRLVSDVSSTLDDFILSVDEVVSLEADDAVVVVEDANGLNLVLSVVGADDGLITELVGVRILSSSVELVLLWLERLEAKGLWERLRSKIKEVEITAEASAKGGEVLSIRSLNIEVLTSLTTDVNGVSVVGGDLQVVDDVTSSAGELSNVFILFELEVLVVMV